MKLRFLLAGVSLLTFSLALPAVIQEETVPTKLKAGLNQLAEEMASQMNEVNLAKMEKFTKVMSKCDYNELVKAMEQAIKSDYNHVKMTLSKK